MNWLHRYRTAITALLALILLSLLTGTLDAVAYKVEMISVSSDEVAGNNFSDGYSSISADGRFVAFPSLATNLVPGDTNNTCFSYHVNCQDIFVRDRIAGTTSRVSVSSTGSQGNHYSSNPAISADGRFVAFDSIASNLVSDDTNNYNYCSYYGHLNCSDVFVRDRQLGTTTRVSVSSTGEQGNNESDKPAISADGRFISFNSKSSNLVSDDTNGLEDTFVRDRLLGTTTRVSVSSTGEQGTGNSIGNTISADGRFVAFNSNSSNLVPNDTYAFYDIFVHDLLTGATTQVNVSSTGVQANGSSISDISLSADGRFVAFASYAPNLVANDTNNTKDVFRHDRLTGETIRVSVSDAGQEGVFQSGTYTLDMSSDGHLILFDSIAPNLVAGDTNSVMDIFMRDLVTMKTTRINLTSMGEQANGTGVYPSISATGEFIAFTGWATNLPQTDPSGPTPNIFVTTMDTFSTEMSRNYHTALPMTLTWSSVSWAKGYDIQIDSSPDFTEPLDYTAYVPDSQLAVIIDTLPDDTYYWRVRAVHYGGILGSWSAVDSFELNAIP